MHRPLWKILLLSLTAGLLLSALWTPFRYALARPQPAPAFQYIEPFLYSPYPGTATENAVFDHASPDYTQTDNRIVAFTGDQADKFCPNPAPPGEAPPQAGVCDLGSGFYWSYSLGDWMSYNGHDGIDFGIQYRQLYAAANTDQVVYAGWQDPMNHTYALGLYVKLHHPNGYTTSYGHMSAVAVQSCAPVGCASIPHGELIGFSGSTGNSTGPHLHFRVANLSNKSIDPYGWTGETADPWPYNQHNSLWAQNPSVIPFYGSTATVLPTDGVPLAYPAPVTNAIVVDDSSPGFSETPAGCWTVVSTTAGQSENGSMRFVHPVIDTSATCAARWNFPAGQPAGSYAVYVRIPAIHANSEGALYTIVHDGRSDIATVNQEVFPNPYHVTDGWLYIGKYDFSAGGNEYVSLPNRTQDTASTYQTRELGADAVRFVPLSGIGPTDTPGPSPTPSSTPTPTNTGTITFTYTPSSTGTATRTLRPTDTRWPTWTPSSTRTLRPTDTRWPTLTRYVTNTPGPSPTRTLTFTVTPSFTRTFTVTRSNTPTLTFSRTPTPSRTPTSSRTFTPTRTFTQTRSLTPTRTPSITPGPSPTRTPYRSPTKRPTDTRWPTQTRTPSKTPGPSPTRTPSLTRTPTRTPIPSLTKRPTDTRWPSPTLRPTDTRWPTQTRTPTRTP